jgi:hypothetical protein
LPKYTYKTIKSVVEQTYKDNADIDIYEKFGDIDLANAKIVITAKDDVEAEALHMCSADIRMWELDTKED